MIGSHIDIVSNRSNLPFFVNYKVLHQQRPPSEAATLWHRSKQILTGVRNVPIPQRIIVTHAMILSIFRGIPSVPPDRPGIFSLPRGYKYLLRHYLSPIRDYLFPISPSINFYFLLSSWDFWTTSLESQTFTKKYSSSPDLKA